MTRNPPRLLLTALALFLLVNGPVLAGKLEPAVIVRARYPGASAQAVADALAAPIEQQVNGVEGMRFMVSRSTNDGTYTLTITFKAGIDPDKARGLVRDRVNLAEPMLPDAVRLAGLEIRPKPPGVLMLVNFWSPDGSRDSVFLTSYATVQLRDELVRVPGVADVTLLGQSDLAFHVLLDPAKLASHNLTVVDVANALRPLRPPARATGDDTPATTTPHKGKAKSDPSKPFEFTINTEQRLIGQEDLEKVIVKTDSRGRTVRLKDVARVEVGATGREHYASYNGKPGVVLAVYPTSTSRPREVSREVRTRLAELRSRLPAGLDLAVVFDFTPNLDARDRPTVPDWLLLEPEVPVAASLQRSHAIVERCAKWLRQTRPVRDVLSLSADPFDGIRDLPCILVSLQGPARPRADRERLIRELRPWLRQATGLSARWRDLSVPGPTSWYGSPLDLAVRGPEAKEVRELARKVAARMARSKSLTDVWLDRAALPQPQLYLDIDRTAAARQGISEADVFTTLQVYYGGLSDSDFQRFGRSWQVVVQADSGARQKATDIAQLRVRNAHGDMVPLSTFCKLREVKGPLAVTRFNGEPMVEITANPAAGVSLAEAHKACEQVADEVRKELRLPKGYRLAWLSARTVARPGGQE